MLTQFKSHEKNVKFQNQKRKTKTNPYFVYGSDLINAGDLS